MYGCLASPWRITHIHDPKRPWSWELVFRSDFLNRRCVCRGNAKTRHECLTEIDALLADDIQEPLATRIWCDSNTL